MSYIFSISSTNLNRTLCSFPSNIGFTFGHDMSLDDVSEIINNNPYTIINWKDGTKTIVKCQEDDVYNFETGVALCFMKKAFGNDGSYNEVFHKFCEKNNVKSKDRKITSKSCVQKNKRDC